MKISVIVPTYNQESTLAKCLDGILIQRLEGEIEILIGDDGSEDATPDICAVYASKFPDKIRVLRTEPEDKYFLDGRPSGRKNLIRLLTAATGEFIAFCEGDDYWTNPSKLQSQLAYLLNNADCGLCFHDVDYIERDGTFSGKRHSEVVSRLNGSRTDFTFDELLRENFVPTLSVVMRRPEKWVFPEWYYKVPFGDWFLNLQVAENRAVHYIPEVMAAYRLGGTWSGRSVSEREIAIFQFYLHLQSYFGEQRASQIQGILQEKFAQHARYVADLLSSKDYMLEQIKNRDIEVQNLTSEREGLKNSVRALEEAKTYLLGQIGNRDLEIKSLNSHIEALQSEVSSLQSSFLVKLSRKIKRS